MLPVVQELEGSMYMLPDRAWGFRAEGREDHPGACVSRDKAAATNWAAREKDGLWYKGRTMSRERPKPHKKENTMPTTIAVEDITLTLPQLLDRLTPGEEIILTRNQQPVAKLVAEQPKPLNPPRPGPGLGKGMITFVAPDFDAPLEDMKEYME